MKQRLFVAVCSVICMFALAFTTVNVIRYFRSNSSVGDDHNISIASYSDDEDIIDVRNMAVTSIEILPNMIDFGNVVSDTVLSASFSIRNTGSELLYIQRLKADCICTSVESSKVAASPGDSIVVTMKLNTKGKEGKNVVYTTFMANTQEVEHKLRLVAKVN